MLKEWQQMNQKQPYLYIGKAPITGKFMVFMKFRNETVGISPHRTMAGAKFAQSQCQRCLDSLPKNFWDKKCFDTCFGEFIIHLVENFNYPDDDEIIGVAILEK